VTYGTAKRLSRSFLAAVPGSPYFVIAHDPLGRIPRKSSVTKSSKDNADAVIGFIVTCPQVHLSANSLSRYLFLRCHVTYLFLYTVHVQNTGSVRVNRGHGSLASRVGSGLGSVSLTRFHLCCQRRRCSPVTLDSGNIRFVRIFAGVPWKGGVIQQWGNRKRVFSGFRTLCILHLRK